MRKPINDFLTKTLKHMKNHLITSLLFFLAFSCSTPSTKETTVEGDKVFEIDHSKVVDLLVSKMDLQEGEKVLLVASPGRFDPLVDELSRKIVEASGDYLGAISVTDKQPEKWSTAFTEGIGDLAEDELKEYLKEVDLGVMLPGPTPADQVYYLIQENLNEEIGRTIHFHWVGAYDLNGNELAISPEIDEFYQNVLLNTDYDALATAQLNLESAMCNQAIRVTTPKGTDISFQVGDRPVTKQNGNASAAQASTGRNLIDREIELPAGAVRVAPVEVTVNGIIAFPDAIWGDSLVSDLKLTFEKGVVIDMEASSNLESVRALMQEQGIVAKSFREFALGMNPNLAIPEIDPWIPYYGYGAGIVRLSLGDNIELGGDVSGGFVRWNFFPDATVTIGEDVWVQDGKLVE